MTVVMMAEKPNQVSKKILDKQRGRGIRLCKKCGTTRGLIRKYGICLCRRCFRESGEDLGFFKYH
jgi:small subunit ribosomal protein S14